MGNSNDQKQISVESLIRLKRHEKPDPKFWDSFETDFQRRRLQVLMVQEKGLWASPTRLLGKLVAIGAPACAVGGIVWLGMSSINMSDTLDPSRQVSHVGLNSISEASESPMESVTALPSPAVGGEDFPVAMAGYSQFVMDVIQQEESNRSRNFSKVIYNSTLDSSPQPGSRYVRDSFVPGEYRVTTAEMKFGRNF